MSAHVRCGIRPDWTDRVRRRRVNTRSMQHILQRIRASRERQSRQLHGVSAERYDVPTHVRRALHGVGRHEVRGRDVHPRAVPRTVRHGHLVLLLQQAEGVQRAGEVRAPGLPDAAAAAADMHFLRLAGMSRRSQHLVVVCVTSTRSDESYEGTFV